MLPRMKLIGLAFASSLELFFAEEFSFIFGGVVAAGGANETSSVTPTTIHRITAILARSLSILFWPLLSNGDYGLHTNEDRGVYWLGAWVVPHYPCRWDRARSIDCRRDHQPPSDAERAPNGCCKIFICAGHMYGRGKTPNGITEEILLSTSIVAAPRRAMICVASVAPSALREYAVTDTRFPANCRSCRAIASCWSTLNVLGATIASSFTLSSFSVSALRFASAASAFAFSISVLAWVIFTSASAWTLPIAISESRFAETLYSSKALLASTASWSCNLITILVATTTEIAENAPIARNTTKTCSTIGGHDQTCASPSWKLLRFWFAPFQ